MSTELKTIKGLTEFVEGPNEAGYKENKIYLTRFYGGTKRGTCVQLTIDEAHIQLTKSEIGKLIRELSKVY